jgi:uncharacterized protein YkwD
VVVVLLLAVCAVVLPSASAVATTSSVRPCTGENSSPNGRNSALIDAAALCLMNKVRVVHRLPALRFNGSLARIASGQTTDMVRGHYFGDQSISGQSAFARIMASGYVAHPASMRVRAAQNIGWGMGHGATPAGIVQAWMASPPHRAIILTASYRDTGVGVSPSVPSGFSGRWHGGTYAAEFGIRSR